MTRVSHGIDRVEVIPDEPNLVANAGLILPATLMARLGLEALVNQIVDLSGRVGGASPGRKVLTLVATMLAGWSHIAHADVLRTGSTAKVLGFRVMAPSTLGTFLRSFTWGHVRQLDKVAGVVLGRAWAAGAGPDSDELLVVDLDSTICEVHGHNKQGAAYGYTGELGYHPLVATRSDTGEVLHSRLRAGSSQRGHVRFVSELVARIRRAGHQGPICVRADGGFWSHTLIVKLDQLGVDYSITVRLNQRMRRAITGICEADWAPITYPNSGEAAVADTIYKTRKGRVHRLVVRRSRLTDPAQQAFWPDWRYHAFVTSSEADEAAVDLFHREHARVELAIRDLKNGSGAEHMPSGVFCANAAWLACAVLAHNLIRWADTLAGTRHTEALTTSRTYRQRFIALPGRLVNHARKLILRIPTNWPFDLTRPLDTLRALPAPSG